MRAGFFYYRVGHGYGVNVRSLDRGDFQGGARLATRLNHSIEGLPKCETR